MSFTQGTEEEEAVITREEVENYLSKGGYKRCATPYETELKGVISYQYKDSDMFFDVGFMNAWSYDRGQHLSARIYTYSEWSIDPNCGCLVQR